MSSQPINSAPPPEDLPAAERIAPAKPKSNSRMYLGVAAGCLVFLCLCCVGSAVAITQMPDLQKPIVSVLGGVLPEPVRGMLVQATATPVRPPVGVPTRTGGLPPATGVAPVAKPTVSAQPTIGGGGAAVGNPFAEAVAKAKTANKYRIESSFIVGSTTNGKFEEMALMDMKGVVDGKNTQFEIKGGMFAMLGGAGALEVMQADGKSYIRGMSLMGMDPKQWYQQKDGSLSGSTDSFAKPDYFNDFTSGAKAGEIKKVRSESVDGQQCDVYSYDYKSMQNSALVGLMGSAKDKDDFSVVDKGEMLTWLCADGYVHKFTFDFQAHNAKDVNEKGSLKMNGHMWDFNNAAIKVTEPTNAKPFPGQ